MDGVSGLNQVPIPRGETAKYDLTLKQYDAHMYHYYFDETTQIRSRAMGLFIIHPKDAPKDKIVRDFAFIVCEWRVDPATSRVNPCVMFEFNLLTLNSKVFPAIDPLVAKYGIKCKRGTIKKRFESRKGNKQKEIFKKSLH